MTASVKRNYLRFNGYRYYKGRAQTIELGDWGRKHTPATRANYLDQRGSLAGLVGEVSVTTFRLNQANTNKGSLIGNFSMAMFGVNGDDFYQDAMAGKWEFVEIHLRNEEKFRRALNRRRGRLDVLKRRDDYRIVDSVIVVMRAREVRAMRMGHKGKFKGVWNAMSLTITDSGESSRQSTFEIDPGAVYAYGLKKLKWNARSEKKRTSIEELRDDPHGP